MQALVEIIKILIPAAAVVVTVYIMLNKHFNHQLQVLKQEAKNQNSNHALPLKLQAYERLVLLAERITLHNLVLRLSTSGMTVKDFQLEMIEAVRSEYEHNLSQQLYVSDEAWALVVQAKEEVLISLNQVAAKLNPKEEVGALIQALFDHLQTYEVLPSTQVISKLKSEASQLG